MPHASSLASVYGRCDSVSLSSQNWKPQDSILL